MIGQALDEVPDLPEPITAIRYFMLDMAISTPTLISPLMGDEWGAGEDQTAICRDPGSGAPHQCPSHPDGPRHSGGHGCGLYSYKSLHAAAWDFPIRGLLNHQGAQSTWGALVGVYADVVIWGHVFEHDRGYRSEFCRITGIFHIEGVGHLNKEILRVVADFYGVPLIEMDAEVTKEINAAIESRQAGEVEEFVNALTAFVDTLGSVINQALGRESFYGRIKKKIVEVFSGHNR